MPSAFRPTRILTGMRAARKRKNRSAYRTPASFLGGNPSYRIWGSVNMEELYISISQTRSQPEFFISAGRGRQSQDTHRVSPLFQIPSAAGSFISGGRKQGEPESRYGKTYNRKHKTIRKMNRSKKNGRTIGAMALIASMIPVVLTAQARETGVDKTTWLYAVKGTDSLYMDRYVAEASRETNAPCLIFAFGGGFVGGERDNPAYVPYFEYFARKGYAVVSIDYRLGLRETAGSRPDPAATPEALAERFFAAVDMAVEDLYDATSFIVGQARAWGLDPSAVVASGSSAGAITVLQGEYERCTGSALSRRLPGKASAMQASSPSQEPFWRKAPPVRSGGKSPPRSSYFTAMRTVTFLTTASHGGAALYGSFYLSRQFRRMNTPFYFYSVSGAAHEMAVRPMDRNRAEIEIFLDRLVLGREPLMIETQVEPGSELRPHGKRSRFRTSSGPTREHRPNPLRLRTKNGGFASAARIV